VTKNQRDERVLVVWSDTLDNIILLCQDFEDKLIKLVWSARPVLSAPPSFPSSLAPSLISADADGNPAPESSTVRSASVDGQRALVERDRPSRSEKKIKGWFGWSWKLSSSGPRDTTGDVEKGGAAKDPRPIRLFAPFYGGLGAALSICEFLAMVFNRLRPHFRALIRGRSFHR
jgi:hypothetical protein